VTALRLRSSRELLQTRSHELREGPMLLSLFVLALVALCVCAALKFEDEPPFD